MAEETNPQGGREPGRYDGVPEADGRYAVPEVTVVDLDAVSVQTLDGGELLRAFEYLVRGAGAECEPESLLIAVRRELQLRLGLITADDFTRLLDAARFEDAADPKTGVRTSLRYGEPTCPVCGANQLDWPACDTGEPCPKGCGGTVHSADGEASCSNYYATPKRCDYHESADDALREYEGADSPAGVRHHEPEDHSLDG